MDKINILLVDDHAVLRTGLRLLLDSQKDMEIVGETGSGIDALKLASELRPRVILLDLSLDDTNGLHILSELKSIDSSIKVLVLTMHDDEGYIHKVLEVGGDGYILKKAADVELITAIRAVNRDEIFLDPSLTRAVLKGVYDIHHSEYQDIEGSEEELLSNREKEVLKLVALGYTNKQIADRLVVSIKTVESYKARAREKLNMNYRSELVEYAIQKGLLSNEEKELGV
ncbi:MAG: response regulator transcription factor [Syntrophales bacterium]|nr:response regulator transcription factor [Syntrophales bacterium]